jgi:hypothetical protein
MSASTIIALGILAFAVAIALIGMWRSRRRKVTSDFMDPGTSNLFGDSDGTGHGGGDGD